MYIFFGLVLIKFMENYYLYLSSSFVYYSVWNERRKKRKLTWKLKLIKA